MRVFSLVVGALVCDVLRTQAKFPECGAVGPQLVSRDPGWRAMFLQKLAHELFRGSCVAARLNQKVQNFAFIVYGSPKPITSSSNDDGHFVQMPMVTRNWSMGSQIACNGGPKFQTPTSHRFIGQVQTPFGQEIFDISEAQSESIARQYPVLNSCTMS